MKTVKTLIAHGFGSVWTIEPATKHNAENASHRYFDVEEKLLSEYRAVERKLKTLQQRILGEVEFTGGYKE